MPLNERDYMRHDYKYRTPDKRTNTGLLRRIILLTLVVACATSGIYTIVARQPSKISVASFATELNRYRISNGYSVVTFEEPLNTRALKIAETIEKTGKTNVEATVTYHLDFARSPGQVMTGISQNTNDNDAVLRSNISSAGFGMSNRTIVIILK